MDRHHNAPPLAERLQLDHESLAAQVEEAKALVPGDLRPVTSEEEAGEYAETAKVIKGIASMVEAERKKEKAAILEAGRTVDAFFSKMADPLKALTDKLVAAINAFQRAKLEAERKAAEEAKKKAEEEAALFDEPAPVVAPVAVREVARVTSIGGAKATASRKWVHEVTDPDAVPRQYLMVNDAAIKAAIAGGKREIPGVRIYEDIRTAIR